MWVTDTSTGVGRTSTTSKSVRRFTYDVLTDDLGNEGKDITDEITVGRNHVGTEWKIPERDTG